MTPGTMRGDRPSSAPRSLLLLLLLAVAAPVPAAASDSADSVDPPGAGSPIDPERLAPLWRPVEGTRPAGLGLSPRASGCAVVAFTIDAEGVARDLTVVRSHPDDRFGAAARVVIEARRWEPGPANPSREATATFEILSFGQRRPRTGSRVGGGLDPAVFAPCDLDAKAVAARLADPGAAR